MAAACTNIGVDGHVVAGGRDGAGRAEIEAAGAADDPRAGMRAQVVVEGDVAWLFKAADEVARLQNRLQHGGRTAGIGAQITIAQIGGWEKGAAAGEVEDDIAAATAPLSREGPNIKRAARGRGRLREIVDDDLERAEMPAWRF